MRSSDEKTDECRKPLISIVIPARHSCLVPSSVQSVWESDFPRDRVEILVIHGNNPSAQRNQGAQQAKGNIIYFLDDDSSLSPQTLPRLLKAFDDFPLVSVVGGPAVGSENGNLFQRCCSEAMASIFGCGPIRYRYASLGPTKICGEENLILANLAIRADIWHASGGFNPRLYPNEENEFIRRLQRKGHVLLYAPDVLVSRPSRQNLVELFHQAFRYGQGRVKHFHMAPHTLNPVLMLPLLFIFYLLFSSLMLKSAPLYSFKGLILILPLLCYCTFSSISAFHAGLSASQKRIQTIAFHPLIYMTLHTGYGVGMLFGLKVFLKKPHKVLKA